MISKNIKLEKEKWQRVLSQGRITCARRKNWKLNVKEKDHYIWKQANLNSKLITQSSACSKRFISKMHRWKQGWLNLNQEKIVFIVKFFSLSLRLFYPNPHSHPMKKIYWSTLTKTFEKVSCIILTKYSTV